MSGQNCADWYVMAQTDIKAALLAPRPRTSVRLTSRTSNRATVAQTRYPPRESPVQPVCVRVLGRERGLDTGERGRREA